MIAIIGILVAMLLPAVQAAREAARRIQCVNNIKQMALGAHNFADANGALPPAVWNTNVQPKPFSGFADGSCCCPCRFNYFFLILPFVEEGDFWDQFDSDCSNLVVLTRSDQDRTYNQAGNNALRETKISLYFCPSDSAQSRTMTIPAYGNYSRSNYAYAISVDGFHNNQQCTYDSLTDRRTALYMNSRTQLADVKDGTSHTIFLSEMIAGLLDDTNDADIRGFWSDTFGASFSGMFTPNSSVGDRCQSNCKDEPKHGIPAQPYQNHYWGSWANGARSTHVGGVNAARCDGSVEFVEDSIDIQVWQALLSMDGRQRD